MHKQQKKENCISHFTMHTETHSHYIWILILSFHEHFKNLHFEREKKLSLVSWRAIHLLYCGPAKKTPHCSLTCYQVFYWIWSHVYFHKNEKTSKQIGQPHNWLFPIYALVQQYYGMNALVLLLGGAAIHIKNCIISHIIVNGIVGNNVREGF